MIAGPSDSQSIASLPGQPNLVVWRAPGREAQRVAADLATHPTLAPADRRLLNDVRMLVWRGAQAYAVVDSITLETVAINVTTMGARNYPGWGRYITQEVIYVVPRWRRRGIARRLQRLIEANLTNAYSRVKTLSGSWSGFMTHLALGYDMYGLTAKGEMICDSPLEDRAWPDGLPPSVLARAATAPARLGLLTAEAIVRILPTAPWCPYLATSRHLADLLALLQAERHLP